MRKTETSCKRIPRVAFGRGASTILVLSQILPEWKARNSPFPSWFGALEKHYRIVVVDSLGLAMGNPRPEAALHSLVRELRPVAFVGLSYGGLLLRTYLSAYPVAMPAVYLSTPHLSSRGLSRKIGRLIRQLEADDLEGALGYLGQLTGSTAGAVAPNRRKQATRRLLFGFHNLRDLLPKLDSGCVGQPALSLYGKNSRLVTGENQLRAGGMRVRGVQGAGMRVLEDQNDRTLRIISRFISRNGEKA